MKIIVNKTVRYKEQTSYEGEQLKINDKDKEEFERKNLIKEIIEEPHEDPKEETKTSKK